MSALRHLGVQYEWVNDSIETQAPTSNDLVFFHGSALNGEVAFANDPYIIISGTKLPSFDYLPYRSG